MRFQNTLQIGTTGMLSIAGEWLAAHSEKTTVVSRTPQLFTEQLNNHGHRAQSISCNYNVPNQLQDLITNLGTNKYDLILAWIHKGAVPLLEEISSNCSTDRTRIIWVVGSDFHNPAKEGTNKRTERPSLPDHVSLEIVVLGFQIECGRSRWLSHQEISQGVIGALKTLKKDESVIGHTKPWSSKP
ncbi:hypothetical protein [Kiloniella majae]|uniref:hypothetical protein n=1 Tax=Kiloniella majae TaxID=1938558 RepID=UPI000F77740F|nr:hypothetical protein [Kiloniella majae]